MRLIDAVRRVDRRRLGGGLLCGGPLGMPLPTDPFPAGGALWLALLGIALVAAMAWMIRRWGARPATLPAGATPPAGTPRRDRRPRRLPAPAGEPAALPAR